MSKMMSESKFPLQINSFYRIPVPRVGGSSPFWRTKNGSSHSGWPVFDVSGGTRTISCRCPVDICSAAAGRRRLLSVTSPFWRTGNESPYRDGPFLMCQGDSNHFMQMSGGHLPGGGLGGIRFVHLVGNGLCAVPPSPGICTVR